MTQYLRRYSLRFAIPWKGEQDILDSPSLEEVSRKIDRTTSINTPQAFVSPAQYVAELNRWSTMTEDTLKEWKEQRRANTAKRWEAFSQGGGEFGKDFEEGVGQLLTITDLHIEFDIEEASNDMETGGDCEIVVYNLSDQTLRLLEMYAEDQVLISLEAGYVDDIAEIYAGVITGIKDSFEQESRVTVITCQKGGPLKDLILAKYYKKGTPLENVVVDLVEETGMSVSFPSQFESLFTLKSDLYVYSNPQEALKQVLDAYDMIAAIKGAVIDIVPSFPVYLNDVINPYKISPDTGLIGIPALMKDENSTSESVETQPSKLNSKTGVEFTMLLNPNVKVQDYILLESVYISGLYRMSEIKYVGSYEGEEWFCECKAEAVTDLTWREDILLRENILGG